MNEAETRLEHIDPAPQSAGWGVVEESRIRREYPIRGAYNCSRKSKTT
jgi:type I restriction enzyme R subunit